MGGASYLGLNLGEGKEEGVGCTNTTAIDDNIIIKCALFSTTHRLKSFNMCYDATIANRKHNTNAV